MERLLPLTEEQWERARQRLMNPPPGSRMQAAKDYGIDLTLLITQLRLTPDERARSMEIASEDLAEWRRAGRKLS